MEPSSGAAAAADVTMAPATSTAPPADGAVADASDVSDASADATPAAAPASAASTSASARAAPTAAEPPVPAAPAAPAPVATATAYVTATAAIDVERDPRRRPPKDPAAASTVAPADAVSSLPAGVAPTVDPVVAAAALARFLQEDTAATSGPAAADAPVQDVRVCDVAALAGDWPSQQLAPRTAKRPREEDLQGPDAENYVQGPTPASMASHKKPRQFGIQNKWRDRDRGRGRGRSRSRSQEQDRDRDLSGYRDEELGQHARRDRDRARDHGRDHARDRDRGRDRGRGHERSRDRSHIRHHEHARAYNYDDGGSSYESYDSYDSYNPQDRSDGAPSLHRHHEEYDGDYRDGYRDQKRKPTIRDASWSRDPDSEPIIRDSAAAKACAHAVAQKGARESSSVQASGSTSQKQASASATQPSSSSSSSSLSKSRYDKQLEEMRAAYRRLEKKYNTLATAVAADEGRGGAALVMSVEDQELRAKERREHKRTRRKFKRLYRMLSQVVLEFASESEGDGDVEGPEHEGWEASQDKRKRKKKKTTLQGIASTRARKHRRRQQKKGTKKQMDRHKRQQVKGRDDDDDDGDEDDKGDEDDEDDGAVRQSRKQKSKSQQQQQQQQSQQQQLQQLQQPQQHNSMLHGVHGMSMQPMAPMDSVPSLPPSPYDYMTAYPSMQQPVDPMYAPQYGYSGSLYGGDNTQYVQAAYSTPMMSYGPPPPQQQQSQHQQQQQQPMYVDTSSSMAQLQPAESLSTPQDTTMDTTQLSCRLSAAEAPSKQAALPARSDTASWKRSRARSHNHNHNHNSSSASEISDASSSSSSSSSDEADAGARKPAVRRTASGKLFKQAANKSTESKHKKSKARKSSSSSSDSTSSSGSGSGSGSGGSGSSSRSGSSESSDSSDSSDLSSSERAATTTATATATATATTRPSLSHSKIKERLPRSEVIASVKPPSKPTGVIHQEVSVDDFEMAKFGKVCAECLEAKREKRLKAGRWAECPRVFCSNPLCKRFQHAHAGCGATKGKLPRRECKFCRVCSADPCRVEQALIEHCYKGTAARSTFLAGRIITCLGCLLQFHISCLYNNECPRCHASLLEVHEEEEDEQQVNS